MNEPIAYLNGQNVPFSSVTVSPFDAGFVLGTTVAEQLRTFRGKLFRLEDHLGRLAASLEIIGVSITESTERLVAISHELVAHNHALLEEGDDLGLGILVTPGGYAGYGATDDIGATVILHTYPLPFHLWHEKYERGQALVIPPTRQVPGVCWPSALKCRSRMHYYLADREAQAVEREARALLLDSDGHVTEASTANVLVLRAGEGLLSPPHDKVLPGISLAEAAELAEQMGVPLAERDLASNDLRTADEVFLTSTPLCLLPVASLDGQKIGAACPGNLFHRLMAAWSELVDLDIVGQSQQFAHRR
jgi:branched-subunit amino acid aminotransferase/4-amino-4-deoxychorismate lyase